MGKKYMRPLIPLVPPVFTAEEIHANEYFAGLSDADGYIRVYGNRCYFEMTQASWNINLLELFESKFGGRIWAPERCKNDPLSNTIVYRVSTKEAMIKLAFMFNGNVRSTARSEQFKKLCILLNIEYIAPVELTKENCWHAGMFDGDGCISFHFGEKRNTEMKVTSQYSADVEFFLKNFGGRVVKCSKNASKWTITSREEIVAFSNSLKLLNLKSNKKVRIDLVNDYFDLSKKRPLAKGSPYYQDWLDFAEKWHANRSDKYRKDCKERPYTAVERAKREAEEGERPGGVKTATAGEREE
jgi:hypothetical protein